jgi:hypothetical protein
MRDKSTASFPLVLSVLSGLASSLCESARLMAVRTPVVPTGAPAESVLVLMPKPVPPQFMSQGEVKRQVATVKCAVLVDRWRPVPTPWPGVRRRTLAPDLLGAISLPAKKEALIDYLADVATVQVGALAVVCDGQQSDRFETGSKARRSAEGGDCFAADPGERISVDEDGQLSEMGTLPNNHMRRARCSLNRI